MRLRRLDLRAHYILKGWRLLVELVSSVLHKHPIDEVEAIKVAFPGEVLSVEEYGKLYVVRTKGCDPNVVKRFKNILKRMGYKKLSKKVVVACNQH